MYYLCVYFTNQRRMNLTTNLLFSLLFLLSVVLQCIFGNFSFEFFAFPLNAVIALLWIVLIWYGYKELRNWVIVRILLSSSATRWTLGWFLAGCLVIGLFPQLSPEDATRKQGPFAMLGCYNFMSSWIFVAGLFSLLTHLGMITVRRYLLSGKKHWRFILNHAGLWLALFAGFVGSASEQTLRLPVFRDKPNNEAFTSQGRTVFLDKPFQLKEFAVEHYANGTPRHFFADIIVDEQVIRLEVNHPYSAGWGEDYYLTSYDMHSPEPAYCVVQIVREPLKYVMLAGIIMMLVGGFLLFLEGPKRSDASSAEKQN